jgi:hypothetical protein
MKVNGKHAVFNREKGTPENSVGSHAAPPDTLPCRGHCGMLLHRNRAAGFDQFDNDSSMKIDHGDFIRAFAADERQFGIGTEGHMRRGTADCES